MNDLKEGDYIFIKYLSCLTRLEYFNHELLSVKVPLNSKYHYWESVSRDDVIKCNNLIQWAYL